MHHKVVIIGSGPAGLTAALYAARANLEPLVIRGLQPGGLIATTSEVENYPGFVDGIGGFELAEAMEKQAARFGAQFLDSLVTKVEVAQRPFTIHTDSGRRLLPMRLSSAPAPRHGSSVYRVKKSWPIAASAIVPPAMAFSSGARRSSLLVAETVRLMRVCS